MVQLRPQFLKYSSAATLVSKHAVAMRVPSEKTVFKRKKGGEIRGERGEERKRKAVCLLWSASIMLIGNKEQSIVGRALNQPLI